MLDRKSSSDSKKKVQTVSPVTTIKKEPLLNFSRILNNPESISIPTSLNHIIDSSREHDINKFWTNKIKVILKVQEPKDANTTSCVTLNKQQNCIGLIDPTPSRRSSHTSNNHVNLFPFDCVQTDSDPLNVLSTQALTNTIIELFRGKDSCIFSFGHSGLGKTKTMIGNDNDINQIGVIPHAFGLIYRLLEMKNNRTMNNNNNNSSGILSSSKFTISISAVVVNRTGIICDLLQSSSQQASITKNDSSSFFNAIKRNNSPVELPAVNLKEASRILDMVLATRSSLINNNTTSSGLEHEQRMTHLKLIIHLYQSSINNNNNTQAITSLELTGQNNNNAVNTTKSRLILLDLGSGRYSSDEGGNNCLSVQGMCKVLLALYTSQLHIPHKDSQLTKIMRDSIHPGSHAVMLLHISGKQQNYNETLQVVQLASKLYRTSRSRTSRSLGGSSSGSSRLSMHHHLLDETASSCSSSSGGAGSRRLRPHMGISGACSRRSGTSSASSELEITSASEMSSCCETVIYRGPTPSGGDTRSESDRGDSYNQHNQSNSGSVSNEENKNYCSPNVLRRRRISPRTNARAWPITNSNISPLNKNNLNELGSTIGGSAELWVDGPNAVYKQQQQQQQQQQNNSNVIPVNIIEQTYLHDNINDSKQQAELVISSKMVSKETQCDDVMWESSSSLAEDDDVNGGITSGSSVSNTLDRAHKEPRPLSDISECTEETESKDASSIQGDNRSNAEFDLNSNSNNNNNHHGDIDELLETAIEFTKLNLPGKHISTSTSPLLSRSNILLNHQIGSNYNNRRDQNQNQLNYSRHCQINNATQASTTDMKLLQEYNQVYQLQQQQRQLQQQEQGNQSINNTLLSTDNKEPLSENQTKSTVILNEDNKNLNKNDNNTNSTTTTNNNQHKQHHQKQIQRSRDSKNDNNETISLSSDNNMNNGTTSGSMMHYHSAGESARRYSKSSISDQKERKSNKNRNCKKCKQHMNSNQSEGSMSTTMNNTINNSTSSQQQQQQQHNHHHHSRRHHHNNNSISNPTSRNTRSMTSSCSSTDFNRVASWIETVEKETTKSPTSTTAPQQQPPQEQQQIQLPYSTVPYYPREIDVLTTAHSEPPTTRSQPAFYYPPVQGSQPDISLNYHQHYHYTTPNNNNNNNNNYSLYDSKQPLIYYPTSNTNISVNYNQLPLPPVPLNTSTIDTTSNTNQELNNNNNNNNNNKPKSKTLPRDLYTDLTNSSTHIKRNHSDLHSNPACNPLQKYPTSITPDYKSKDKSKKESQKNIVTLLFGPLLNLKNKMARGSCTMKQSSNQQQTTPASLESPTQIQQYPPDHDHHQHSEWSQQQHQHHSQHPAAIFISSPYNLVTAPKTGHVLPTESSGHGSDSSSIHRGVNTSHTIHKSQSINNQRTHSTSLSGNHRKLCSTSSSGPRGNTRSTTTTTGANNPPSSSNNRQQRRPTSSGYGSIIMKSGAGGDSSEPSSQNDSSSEYSNYPTAAIIGATSFNYHSGIGRLRHSRSLSNCKSSTVDASGYPVPPSSLQIGSPTQPISSRSHSHLPATSTLGSSPPLPQQSDDFNSQSISNNQQNVQIAENLICQEKLKMCLTEERRIVIQLIETNRLRDLCVNPSVMNLTCFKGVDNIEVTNIEQRSQCESLIQSVETEIITLKQQLQHAQNNLYLVTSFDSSQTQLPPPPPPQQHTSNTTS